MTCPYDRVTCVIAPDGSSITFKPCGVTSHNVNDVRHRYCARCNRFVEDK